MGANIYALAAVMYTYVIGRIIDDVIIPELNGPGAEPDALRNAVIALMSVAVVRAVTVVARRYFAAMAEYRTQRTWRHDIFNGYLDAPLAFHRQRSAGERLAHLDADMMTSTMVLKPLPFSVSVFALVLFAVISLALIHWSLALLGAVLFPSLALFSHMYSRRVEEPSAEAQHQIGRVSSIAHESYDGVLVVKTLGRESAEVQRLEDASEDLRVARVRVAKLRGTFEPVIDAMPSLAVLLLLAMGGWLVSTNSASVGQIVQAMTLFLMLALPMRVMGFMLEEMPRSVVALDRIDETLHHAATTPGPRADDFVADVVDDRSRAAVSVEHVSFGFDDVEIIHDVSFRASAGETLAIVGPTGSGKSTLMHLLASLYAPDSGTVRFLATDEDGRPDGVVSVFQEAYLFADSVRENLTLGADISEAEINDALRRCRADGFVAALPDGLDTVVGERGQSLSGGQRQRLALARAILRNPKVLLVDDATSAVDPTIEAEILESLREDLSSMVVVAYRLSTIGLADRVLYLDGGRVVATGTHQELMSEPGYEALIRAYEVAQV
jgi:ATP-binding cassette subfamily B protein